MASKRFQKTREGYKKDGFVVDSSEDSESDESVHLDWRNLRIQRPPPSPDSRSDDSSSSSDSTESSSVYSSSSSGAESTPAGQGIKSCVMSKPLPKPEHI